MKRNKYFVLGISSLIGIAVLTTGVFANFKSATGYDDYKKSFIKLIKTDNVTYEASVRFAVDGKKVESESTKALMDNNGDVKFNITSSNGNSDREPSTTYVQDGKTYYSMRGMDGYEYTVSNGEYAAGLGFGGRNDDKTMDRAIRFGELLADTFIGDLKNNVILVSSDNNESKYTISLDRSQIPEIINAGLMFMVSSNSSSMNYDRDLLDGEFDSDEIFERNPLLLFENDSYIKNASCDVTIDGNGNLTYNKYTVTFAGEDRKGGAHEMVFEIELKAYDYGTTKPERLDTSAVKVYDPQNDRVRIEKSSVAVEVENDVKLERAIPGESVHVYKVEVQDEEIEAVEQPELAEEE